MAVAGAAVLALAMVIGACGGDDDDTGSKSATDSSGAAKDASPAAKDSSPAAKDDSKAADAGPVTGTDKEYVKDVCIGLNTYMDGALKAFQSDPASAADEAVVVKKLGPLLETFAKDVAKAKPPKDVKKYHDEFVKQVKDMSDKLNSGKVTSLTELGEGVTPPKDLDPAIKARLANAEKDVKECQADRLSGIGGLFGNGN